MIENKSSGKITNKSRDSKSATTAEIPKDLEFNENSKEILEERYISPEKREWNIDEIRLM